MGEGACAYTDELAANAGQAVHHFASREEAADFLKQTATAGDLVLLKGSRSAAMDTIYKLYATES